MIHALTIFSGGQTGADRTDLDFANRPRLAARWLVPQGQASRMALSPLSISSLKCRPPAIPLASRRTCGSRMVLSSCRSGES